MANTYKWKIYCRGANDPTGQSHTVYAEEYLIGENGDLWLYNGNGDYDVDFMKEEDTVKVFAAGYWSTLEKVDG